MTILARSSTRIAPSRSATLAAVTSTTTSRPMVSTTRCRLRPMVFLPASQPREPRPTVAAPGTVWESTAPAEASGSRPAASRTASRSAAWTRSTRAVGNPSLEVEVDGVPGREVVRQLPPRAARPIQVQDRIHDAAAGELRWAAAAGALAAGAAHRHQRLDQRPLGIGQIRGIGRGRAHAPPWLITDSLSALLSQHVLSLSFNPAASVSCTGVVRALAGGRPPLDPSSCD